MRYIKMFEDATEQQERLKYKNMVDWNLVHEVEYLLTKYEDEGYRIAYGVDSIWTPTEPDMYLNVPLYRLNEIVDKYFVVYWFSVKHDDEDVYIHPYSIVKDVYATLCQKYNLRKEFFVGGDYISFSLQRIGVNS